MSRKPWRWPWHREPSFAPSFHSSTGVLSEFVVCLCVTGTRPSQGLQPSVLLHLRGPTVCWRMEQKKPLAPHRRRTQIGRTGAPKSGRQAVCAASLLSRAAAVVFAPRYHPPHGLRDNENLVCMAAATVHTIRRAHTCCLVGNCILVRAAATYMYGMTRLPASLLFRQVPPPLLQIAIVSAEYLFFFIFFLADGWLFCPASAWSVRGLLSS